MEIPAGARGRNQAKITELPLGTWTENYRSHLLDMETKGDVVKRFREKFTDSTVMFDVYFTKAGAEMLAGKRRNGKDIMAALNLRKKISSVYYLFDEQANIRRFNGAEHVSLVLTEAALVAVKTNVHTFYSHLSKGFGRLCKCPNG